MFRAAFSVILKKGKCPEFPKITITKKIFPTYKTFSTSTLYQEDYAEKIIKEIGKNDPEIENNLKVMMMEMEIMYQEGKRVPKLTSIKPRHWEELLTKKSISGRRKVLEYIWGIQMKDENLKIKKEERRLQYLEVKRLEAEKLENAPVSSDENLTMEYGLAKSSMFCRIYEQSINKFYNHRLLNSMLFGQKLILDCSYDQYMTSHEATNAAKQMTFLFAENRLHIDPFDLHFFNCSMESKTMQTLFRNIPTWNDPTFPLNIHLDCFTQHFPKDQLVYLTPHCRNELTHYDPDAVYIIGCMVDKKNNDPLSLAKAKELNLKMAKLPLDRYLSWGLGGKSLTLNQMVNILLDLKFTKDWDSSLKHIPKRKTYKADYNKSMKNPVLQNRFMKKDEEFLDKILYKRKNKLPTSYQKRKVSIRSIFDDDDSKI